MIWTILGTILAVWIFGSLIAAGLGLLLHVFDGVRYVFRALTGTTQTANNQARAATTTKKAEHDRQEQEQKMREDQARRAAEEMRRAQEQRMREDARRAYEQERQRSEEEQRKRTEEARRQQHAQRAQIKDEAYYGAVLGLKGEVTPSKIRRIYRDLVAQYHPDKVHHLGPKLRTVAEQEMKAINEAYDFFRKTYDL